MNHNKSVFAGEFLVAALFISSAVIYALSAIASESALEILLNLGLAAVFAFVAIFVPFHRFKAHLVGAVVALLNGVYSVWLISKGVISPGIIVGVPLMFWATIYLARSRHRWEIEIQT